MRALTRRISKLPTCAAALVLAVANPSVHASDSDSLELAVKATYLYKFAAFVEWSSPQAEFPGGTFVICIIGDDPFGILLDRAIKGQAIQDHPIVVRFYPAISANPGCSVAYVTGSPAQSEAAAMSALDNAPVLTVTDDTYAPRISGIIDLVLQDGHIRFAIDDQKAQRHGLRISSKLMSLAISVRLPGDPQ